MIEYVGCTNDTDNNSSGRIRYANNSNYRNDSLIRKESTWYFALLGRKEGFEEKREEFAKVVGWKRSKISNLGSRKLSRGRMGNNRQENMGISDE